MKITDFCIKRPVFSTVLSLVIIVIGIIGYWRMPVRGYPNINPPVVTVTTTLTGASASIIESQITTPIENDLVGANGLQNMYSKSQRGKSRIILHYKLGMNIDSAVNDVRNRLARIMKVLPAGTDTPIIQKRDPNSLQTMVLAVTDPHMSSMALTDYADRYIVPQLEQVLGVASVEIYNARDYAMQILLNPAKMAANHVTVNDLTRVLQAQNVNVPSGQIKSKSRYYSILARGQLNSAKAFRHLIIRDQNGYQLRFGDVAKIKVAPEDTDSAMRVNGKPALGVGVYSTTTANPIKVAKRIKKSLGELRQNLPQGMKLNIIWNNTNFLKASLQNVYHDLAFAILLVVLIVLLFLGSMRSTFIPIVTIPICLIGVCALIYFFGYSLNVFTLLALVLAIGLVVDDAIVMLENIYRHIEQGLPPFKAALKGSREIAFAIVAMTLTLAAVYAPIGFATGMTGIIFRQFAFTLALAVILSGFVALTLSPMMCARLLKLPSKHSNISKVYGNYLDVFFKNLMNGYKKLLIHILKLRWLVVIILLSFVAIGFWCFESLPRQLAPKEDMGIFMTSIKPPANASFAYINLYSKEVGDILRQLPSVKNVLMIVNPDRGGFAFTLLENWSKRQVSSQQLINRVREKASNIPGVRVSAFNMSQIGGGGRYGNSVRMSITSDQGYAQLHKTVAHFLEKVSAYAGIKDATQDLEMNDKQYIVHINRNLAAALQVNMADINNTLGTMIGGAKVTQFDWHDRDYDVILQIPSEKLNNLQIINQLYVRNSAGKMIPLSSLASIGSQVGPQELPHENRWRADTITMQIAPGYTMGQVIHYLQQAAKQYLPNGYQYHFKGAARRLLDSRHTMVGAFTLAIIFIYLVLAAQFESFIDPFVILLTVPLSIVGALFTLKFTGHALSVYTNIGFVTLIGLIAKHGILITEFANQLRAKGKVLGEALIEAAVMRLRPILMTTAAMVVGAIPLALASGAGALSRQDIGWVIVGGLFFGTFFSLIVVPVAYSFLGKFKKFSDHLAGIAAKR